MHTEIKKKGKSKTTENEKAYSFENPSKSADNKNG
jgi:hypothetical protein